jgi:hypothetical protein
VFHEKIGATLSEKIFSPDGKKNIHELESLWKDYLAEAYKEDEEMRNIGEGYFDTTNRGAFCSFEQKQQGQALAPRTFGSRCRSPKAFEILGRE